ncbi:MAG TPA: MBL fold metallo-hydrolase [Gemmatimonadales bacterium]|jgi:phosphoribosyl 1,2-cyclic phosphate phosphodiesterase|nr:MBL fold metallo-hydrolase [Gemmatimonadales bacterium]
MKLTFLGTGTSFGVPQIGCDCAVCRSTDPRDRRTRSGALLEVGEKAILIDTPPELRLQLVAAGRSRVDAVLYTHEHADHINGIDDLRMFSVTHRSPLPVFGPTETLERLRSAFQYIFDETIRPYEGTSKPALELYPIEPGQPVTVAGVDVRPLAFRHGHLRVFGYRIGDLAYITDVKEVPEAMRPCLRGLKVLVLNALWRRPHPTHLSIDEAVRTAQDLGAERTFLTHLTHETGHAELAASLPAGIAPAYDGLTVDID